MSIPSEYGGSELDTMASVVLGEELGQSTFGGLTGSVLAHTDMAVPHLTRFGTPEQKEQFLPGIIAGTTIGAITVSEPDAGSDIARLRTRAVRDGDHYVLNGAKMFITNGLHGDLLFTAVRTDSDARGSRGLSMFIVERQRPGVRVSRALKKIGWLCSDTAEIVFEDCCVPVSHRLGDENKGFYAMMANFQTERIAIAAAAVGEATKPSNSPWPMCGGAKPSIRPSGIGKRSGNASPCTQAMSRQRGSSRTTRPGSTRKEWSAYARSPC